MPLSLLEMDQVSASLSKQDPGHPAKSNRDKVTRRQPARWGSALTKSPHRSRAFWSVPAAMAAGAEAERRSAAMEAGMLRRGKMLHLAFAPAQPVGEPTPSPSIARSRASISI